MSSINEMRDLTIGQLEAMIDDYRKELFALKGELAATRKLEKPHRIRDKKRDVARALMVLSEKKRVK